MHRKLDVCYIIMNGAFLLSPCFLAQTIPFFRAPFFRLRWHMDVCWKGHRSATDQPGDPDLVTVPFWPCFFTWKMNGLEQICVFQMPVMLSQKFAKNTNSQTFRSTRLEAYIYFWPYQATSRILVSPLGIEPRLLPVKALSPKHWNSQKPVFFSLWITLLCRWMRCCWSSFQC